MSRRALFALVFASSLLGGCDMIGNALGIESPEKVAAAREAEGKAIGGACRNAARAIEDCFSLNKKADKAAIFAGWREMNDYMRDNKIDAVAPQATTQVAGAKPAASDADADSDDTAKPDPTPAKPTAKAPGGKRAKPQDG
jgi:hypothetical protein